MGKIKYLREVEGFIQKTPVFDINSLRRFITAKKGNKKYANLMISNLLRQNKIKRLTKGFYTIYDELSLAVFCFKPAYLGLQDALSFHNLWEQETVPVVITARKVRNGIRKSMGANVLMRRIDKRYMFGYDYYNIGKFYLPYSDIEKTFIDMVYFRERLGGEALESIKKRISRKKLNSYLKHYPEMTRKRVLNLLK